MATGRTALSSAPCSVSGRWNQLDDNASGSAAGAQLSRWNSRALKQSRVLGFAVGRKSWNIARPAIGISQRGGAQSRENGGGCHLRNVGKIWTLAVAVAEIEGVYGRKNAFFRSKLPPARELSTLELASCAICLSGDILKPRESEGRLQGRIVKAMQGDSHSESDEARWMREEQRWLREEQRWIREEARWSAANKALQEEVRVLKNELDGLRRHGERGGEISDASLKNLVAGMKTLLQALTEPVTENPPPLLDSLEKVMQMPSTFPLSGRTPTAFAVENSESEADPETVVASSDNVIAVVIPKTNSSSFIPLEISPTQTLPMSSRSANGATSESPTTVKKRTLKVGMEGDDVKELQDALLELGFYSGEEDMEFSTFSGDTDSAVKSWQSTCGVPEDGRVTAELMATLLAEVAGKMSLKKEEGTKKLINLNSRTSIKVETPPQTKQAASSNLGTREIDRYERSDAQESGSGSSRRVYLLGENRWEEPDRLLRKQNEEKGKNGASTGSKVAVAMCFSCRGVGTMLCTDCEGTGDLNVEEQFLEWMEEGAKCPYCEGSGAVQCDVCFGEAIQSKS